MSQNRRWIAVAIFCAPFCAMPAAPVLAQVAPVPQQDLSGATSPVDSVDASAPEPTLSPEDSALLGNTLVFDPLRFKVGGPSKPLHLPGLSHAKALDVARTDRPDGTSTVIVKQALASEWDAKVGADLGLAADGSETFQPGNPLRVQHDGGGAGAAWASLAVPHLATIDARVDPLNDQGRLGTTLTRALPLGPKFTVTLRSRTSLTENFGQPQPAPSELALRAPAAGNPGEPEPHVWGHDNVAKLDILPTGTTLAAGLSSTSLDPVTHNTLSAEQKLYGPLRVTTAVNDIGLPGESKSISARFKLSW